MGIDTAGAWMDHLKLPERKKNIVGINTKNFQNRTMEVMTRDLSHMMV
jgi:hypothetical protein